MRIDPKHAKELTRFLGNYYPKAQWHFETVDGDLFPKLVASSRTLAIAHAFIRGRESATQTQGEPE